MPVTAQEAFQRADAQTRASNAAIMANVPDLPTIIQEHNKTAKIFIYNVSPWIQEQMLGSPGTARIFPCPDGKDYGPPFIVHELFTEFYPGESGPKIVMEGAEKFADAVLGIGPHTSPRNSLVPYGVFKSYSNPPKKEEVAEARRNLV